MTAATDTLRSTSLRAARAEAVVTWAYAGGFGIPAIPVGVYGRRAAAGRGRVLDRLRAADPWIVAAARVALLAAAWRRLR